MAHSILHGNRHGLVHGDKHGALTLGISAPQDSLSLKYTPLTQAHWNAVFDAAGVSRKTVNSTWGFQDASGNAVATVGTNLTASGTITYNQSVSGWTRTAQRFAQDVLARQTWNAGVGPNPATTSVLWLGYIDLTGLTVTNRAFLVAATTGPVQNIILLAGNKLRTADGANNADGAADTVAGGVRPFVLRLNVSTTTCMGCSDIEKLVPTYAAATDSIKGFGAATVPGMDVLYGSHFGGADAEWTDAEVKAVLQTLGWTISWS